MRKVLSFSLFLMLGLVASQLLPGALGTAYPGFKATADTLLYICLGFIMINVGREFEIDKSRWRSYTADYFIAMATAALPWLLIVLYYIFVLLPSDLWTDSAAWKENLLLSRFAAPTSAGILFTMLAALSLKNSWIYRKIQVLAIFDDLDTILLMIPLQILMIGLKWQMFAIVGVVVVLLIAGWRWQARWNVRQDWKRILGLSAVVCALTQALYIVTARWYGPENSIHIEVLLPAFVIGMLMKHREIDTPTERRAATGISFLFMLLVGMSMPLVTGASAADAAAAATSITASQPMMPWGVLILHVVAVSALSNIGKLVPVFFYRDRKLSERLALSIGMFTPRRGGRGRHLHRPGIQPRRPGADHLGADAGAEPDPHGRLRCLGQETGPEKLHTRSIISSTSMKRYAFILLVLLSAGAVRAQRYEKNILGVRAGVNVSTCDISIEDVRINTGSRAGFHFAVTDQILLHRSLPLYLETGVGFSSRGGRAAAEIYGDIYNMTMRPFYMQVPLLVNYHFHIRDLLTIQPFAGIYGGVGIRGAMKTEYGNEDMFSAPGFLSRMDFGARAGAGFVIRRIYLGISYDIGCRDLFRGGEFFGYALQPESAEIRNNCLTVNIGYNF